MFGASSKCSVRIRRMHLSTDNEVFLCPDRVQPGLKPYPEGSVIFVVLVAQVGGNLTPLDVHANPTDATGEQVQHAWSTVRIDDRHVEQVAHHVTHGLQDKADPAGFGREQMRVGTGSTRLLLRGEPRALDEVHHGYRRVAKFFACLAGCLDILAFEMRMLLQHGVAMASHEGKVERPPGEP